MSSSVKYQTSEFLTRRMQ